MMSIVKIRIIRWTCLVAWLVVNAGIAFGIWSGRLHAIYALLVLVAFLNPGYVWLVHGLDKRLKLIGFRCVRKKLAKGFQRKAESSFRRNLRLQMVTITSGFAATLFFLSIQLYFDLGPDRPPLILETMAVLFLAASLLNLLQIVIYDFLLFAGGSSGEVIEKLREPLQKRLQRFGDHSWNALAIPILLAFSLIDVYLCIAVNAAYGCVLFYYYFLPLDAETVEFCQSIEELAEADQGSGAAG